MKHRYLKNVTTLKLELENCTGCGICKEVCPHKVLELKGHKIDIIDKDSCIECGACMVNCPYSAIFVETGTGCALAFIKNMFSRSNSNFCTSNKCK